MRSNPPCPHCRSSYAVIQDCPWEPFAPEPTTYCCSAIGDRVGCGHRWDEVERRITEAQEAVRRIPVTDATVRARANAIAQLEGLGEEMAS